LPAAPRRAVEVAGLGGLGGSIAGAHLGLLGGAPLDAGLGGLAGAAISGGGYGPTSK
jgi:hypothetical protein